MEVLQRDWGALPCVRCFCGVGPGSSVAGTAAAMETAFMMMLRCDGWHFDGLTIALRVRAFSSFQLAVSSRSRSSPCKACLTGRKVCNEN